MKFVVVGFVACDIGFVGTIIGSGVTGRCDCIACGTLNILSFSGFVRFV